MTAPTLRSVLAPAMHELLKLRQALGYQDKTFVTHFASFDRFVSGRGQTDPWLTRDSVEAWVSCLSQRGPRSRSCGNSHLDNVPQPEPCQLIHTDGWSGYDGLRAKGYLQEATILKGKKETASELLPRVHRIVGLLKRWLMGTYQGAVSHKHLDYYLDEFTFRFNRRKSKSRGKLFFRLAQQAVAVAPAPYDEIVQQTRRIAQRQNHKQ